MKFTKKGDLMLKKIILAFLLTVSFSGVSSAIEFSADTITTFKGEHKAEGKMYYRTDKFRTDLKAPAGMIAITRIDKKVVWSLMPKEKMYMEIPFDLKNKPKVEEKFEGEIERKEVGKETIDGHPTKKYLISYQIGNKKDQVYQWIASDIHFPVKTSAVDGSWTQEFKNIKIGPQPDSLFELPLGYTKMKMPQMPGGTNPKKMK